MRIFGEDKLVDRTCPFMGRIDFNCYAPARRSSERKFIVYECSHICKERCPHYHWEFEKEKD